MQVRRYAADGTPLDATEFQVNTLVVGAQGEPEFALHPAGNFSIVWESDGSFGNDTSAKSVQGLRFAADGTPLDAEEFQVNTFTAYTQRDPEIAIDADGEFVVVWESFGSLGGDTSEYSAQMRRFAADGAPLDPVEFQLNTFTTLDQDDSTVAVNPDGTIVVVFESDGSAGTDSDANSVQLRRYDTDGTPLDPTEMQVNIYTTDAQGEPSLAMGADGGFVIVWQSEGSAGGDSSYTSVQARRYAADGTPLDASEFQVNTYTTDTQQGPSVAVDGRGNFIVAWESRGSGGSDSSYRSVQARRYLPDGTAIDASEFQVNSYTTNEQRDSAVAADANGRFIVTWESYGSTGTDTNEFSVQARIFKSIVIFEDGFESGDTTAWSNTVP